jgi:hypothetical protein
MTRQVFQLAGSYLVQASIGRPSTEEAMTSETAMPTHDRTHEAGANALIEIAYGLANGVHTLIPSATAAVVVSIGSEWQLLAQIGPVDISSTWRPNVANQVRDSDLPQQHSDHLVAPFSAVGLHALLIVESATSDQMPRRAHAIVQPLLDAGGILLDRALAVQERDRAVRRVVRLCQHENARPAHTISDLERAVASLWPEASARFHDASNLSDTCWSARRLVRNACEVDQPSVGRTPAYEGLMPLDLQYQIAIPVPSTGGAILVSVRAGGEELDPRSLATAIAMTRDSELVEHA